LGLAFFGLTPAYKKILLDEVFMLCYHGGGGFTHEEVYNMPIRYRHFYLKKIQETHEKQQEAMDKKYGNMMGNESTSEPMKSPPRSVSVPDFVTNASKSKAPKK
jgi:hypothetical protein